MLELFIYDWNDNKTMLGVDAKDVKRIRVRILSGDEIVTVYMKDGKSFSKDSSDDRMFDFFDGEYVVEEEDILKWMTRTSSYDSRWEE